MTFMCKYNNSENFMSDKPKMVAFKSPDPLFLEAEQVAADFSLFPERSPVSLAEQLKGLIDNHKIQARLKDIKQLDVDAYIEQTVLPAQHTKRPGAKDIISGLNGLRSS